MPKVIRLARKCVLPSSVTRLPVFSRCRFVAPRGRSVAKTGKWFERYVSEGMGIDVGRDGTARRECKSAAATDSGGFGTSSSGAVRRRMTGAIFGCFFFGSWVQLRPIMHGVRLTPVAISFSRSTTSCSTHSPLARACTSSDLASSATEGSMTDQAEASNNDSSAERSTAASADLA